MKMAVEMATLERAGNSTMMHLLMIQGPRNIKVGHDRPLAVEPISYKSHQTDSRVVPWTAIEPAPLEVLDGGNPHWKYEKG
jgi:hypothetical protein